MEVFGVLIKGEKVSYKKLLITKKPPIKSAVNAIATQLKYLSMKVFIWGPNFQIKNATRKNLAPLLTADAKINKGRLINTDPDEIAITL